jgi:hypothetical protein
MLEQVGQRWPGIRHLLEVVEQEQERAVGLLPR